MRASLSKSDNALSSLTSVINGRFKRHHSIDDDYPVISSSNDEKKIHVHFHPDLISTDHRVPLGNNNQEIILQKSLFSSELVVKIDLKILLRIIFII
jgi:hypothetical protein